MHFRFEQTDPGCKCGNLIEGARSRDALITTVGFEEALADRQDCGLCSDHSGQRDDSGSRHGPSDRAVQDEAARCGNR